MEGWDDMGTPVAGMGQGVFGQSFVKLRLRQTLLRTWVIEQQDWFYGGVTNWRRVRSFFFRDEAIAKAVELSLKGADIDMSEV